MPSFHVQVARRARSFVEWDVVGALVVNVDDAAQPIAVIPLDAAGEAWAESVRPTLSAWSASMTPEEILAELYDRNSTVTAYSKPSPVVAESAQAAARKLIDREEARAE